MYALKDSTFYTYHIKSEFIQPTHINYTMMKDSKVHKLLLPHDDPDYVRWLKLTFQSFHDDGYTDFQILNVKNGPNQYNWVVVIPIKKSHQRPLYELGMACPAVMTDGGAEVNHLMKQHSQQYADWKHQAKNNLSNLDDLLEF